MLRVVQVVGQMNCGGAETLIMNIFRRIDRQKVQFDFVVHSDQPAHYDPEIRALGGQILHCPQPNSVGFGTYAQALSNVLRQHGPYAAVHSHVYSFSGHVLHVAEQAGVPVRLAHSHSTQDGKSSTLPRILYRRYMRRLIRRHATHMLGCSRAACEALFGPKCWKDSRVQVLRNAIDLAPYASLRRDQRSSLRERLGLPTDVPLIGHVGRFHRQKNHRFLVELFAALTRDLPNAHLVLVGDGPLRAEIEALVHTKGIEDSVNVLGVRSDVPQILGALDLFVLPSLHEGLSIALVEAQAAGLPCVAADSVPREADLQIGLVDFVSLRAGIDQWVARIIEKLPLDRPHWSHREQALRTLGYDIQQAVASLEKIYLHG